MKSSGNKKTINVSFENTNEYVCILYVCICLYIVSGTVTSFIVVPVEVKTWYVNAELVMLLNIIY